MTTSTMKLVYPKWYTAFKIRYGRLESICLYGRDATLHTTADQDFLGPLQREALRTPEGRVIVEEWMHHYETALWELAWINAQLSVTDDAQDARRFIASMDAMFRELKRRLARLVNSLGRFRLLRRFCGRAWGMVRDGATVASGPMNVTYFYGNAFMPLGRVISRPLARRDKS